MIDPTHAWNRSFIRLTIGFVLSIVLTLGIFYIASNPIPCPFGQAALIIGAVILQVLLQLVFFMHLGIEEKPRWNLMIFAFMVLIITIVVAGSIWIMKNLDYNMMPTMSMD